MPIWKKFIESISEAENDNTIIQIERIFAKELIDAHEIQYKVLKDCRLQEENRP